MSSQQSPRPDGRSELRQIAAEALRRALLSRGHGSPGDADGELPGAMRTLADEARARGLRAEELIIVLREAWAGLAEVRSLLPASQRTEAAARAVSVCIREYYAGVGASQRPAAPPEARQS